MKVPFVDLNIQHNDIREEINDAIKNTIDSSSFIGGEAINVFEEKFAHFIGVDSCCGCANGTDSIEILLKALGVGIGDEVIVPAISWLSTSEAVSAVGATPVFVDIDADYYTIDLTKVETAITKNTKAIIPVHLYGQAVNMDVLLQIAQKHKLAILEDCAQAHGAQYNNRTVGSFADCASFSFFPGKNLGAFGDAGAMVSNNSELIKYARMIANHGQQGKHNHLIEGRNSRLDNLQARILNIKLQHLDKYNQQRIDASEIYNDLLKDCNVQVPKQLPLSKHVYHLYVIRSQKRDELMQFLSTQGIQTAIHYPTALPFLKCYEHMKNRSEDFPVAYKYQNEILSLPMFPGITKEQIQYVCEAVVKFS